MADQEQPQGPEPSEDAQLLEAMGHLDRYSKYVYREGELNKRTGNLAKPIEHQAYSIEGRIDTPHKFTDVVELDRQNTFVMCDTEALNIVLTTSLRDSMRSTVAGQLSFHRDLADWKINTGEQFTAEELGQLCRKDYRMFDGSRDQQKNLVLLLRNLKAKVTADLEKKKDDRGNETDNFVRAVESNLPETIHLTPRLFRGHEERVSIEVLLIIHPTGGRDVRISLESVDLVEATEVEGGKLMQEQADLLAAKGFAVTYA